MIFSGETLPMGPGFAERRKGDELSRPLPKVGVRGETQGERLGMMTVLYRNLVAPKPTRRQATSGLQKRPERLILEYKSVLPIHGQLGRTSAGWGKTLSVPDSMVSKVFVGNSNDKGKSVEAEGKLKGK
jgi:hypothetical protein